MMKLTRTDANPMRNLPTVTTFHHSHWVHVMLVWVRFGLVGICVVFGGVCIGLVGVLVGSTTICRYQNGKGVHVLVKSRL